MKKYYIGLLVLAILTLGLGIYTISLGAASKEDKKTYDKAEEIGQTLNSYISLNNEIPESLQKAKVGQVPDTIKYQKISEVRYKICLTYKTARSGYGGTDPTSLLYGAAFSAQYSSSDYVSSYEPSSFYPSYFYKKGENCTTVKPYLSSFNQNSNLDDYDFCNEDDANYELYRSYCENLDSSLDGSSLQ